MTVALLDTHALIWLMQGSSKLGAEARKLSERCKRGNGLLVSAISYWEISELVIGDRLRLSMSVSNWRLAVARTGVLELPVTAEAAIRGAEVMPDHPDRMDRLIVGAAITRDAVLVTADRAVLAWRGPLQRQPADR